MKQLEPGSHFVTAHFTRPTTHAALTALLESKNARAFLDLKDPFFDKETWKSGTPQALTFVMSIATPLALVETPNIQWSEPHQLSFDPYRELTYQLYPFELKHGVTYELRFLARMRAQPTRDDVLKVFQMMGSSGTKPGWDVHKFAMLDRNIKLPGKPNADFTIWCAVAKWNGALSPIVAEDPFTFEDVVALDGEEPVQNSDVPELPDPSLSPEHSLPSNPL